MAPYNWSRQHNVIMKKTEAADLFTSACLCAFLHSNLVSKKKKKKAQKSRDNKK